MRGHQSVTLIPVKVAANQASRLLVHLPWTHTIMPQIQVNVEDIVHEALVRVKPISQVLLHAVQCQVIGGPTKQLAKLIREPIKFKVKRNSRIALQGRVLVGEQAMTLGQSRTARGDARAQLCNARPKPCTHVRMEAHSSTRMRMPIGCVTSAETQPSAIVSRSGT